MLGKVDIVMGSFSKTFASNGGFVATRSRGVQQYLRYFSTAGTFSNALSPIQAAVACKAFEIVDSAEGASRRGSLMRNILSLRQKLVAAGLEQAIHYLRHLSFSSEQIDYLRHHAAFRNVPPDWFGRLADFRFQGDVWAVPEGTAVFDGERYLGTFTAKSLLESLRRASDAGGGEVAAGI